MYGRHHIVGTMNPLYRPVLALFTTLLLAVPAAHAFNTGDIVVDSTRGEARLTQAGKERDIRRGQVVLVPSTLRTGRDGLVDLRQGATTVNVGPETVLDFPAAQPRGEPVERIVQSQGNAFYDVGKREGRKLRVETPYLVAVIKGTQFSVSVQAESTSISLLEGSLEILSSDGDATVALEAGEVAIRRRGVGGITVVDIDAAQVRVPGAGTADGAVATNDARGATGAVADVVADVPRAGAGIVRVGDADVDVGTVAVEVGAGGVANVTAAVDLSGSAIGAEVAATVGVGEAAAIEVATSIDVSGAGAGVEAGASVDLGAGAVGADVAVGVDVSGGGIGATADVDAGLALGPADAGVSAGVDVGADIGVGSSGASVDAGLGAAVDAGPLGTDVAVDVGVAADLGAAPDASVAVDAGVGNVDVAVSAGVDLGSGGIDLGVDVGGVNIDAGLDLGLDSDATDPATDSGGTQGGGLVENVGGLLDGLLRRPRR